MKTLIVIIPILSFLCVVRTSPNPLPNYITQDSMTWPLLCSTGLQQSPIDFAKNVPYRSCN